MVLKKNGWKGSALRALCWNNESIDHIFFFQCVLSRCVWGSMNVAIGWITLPRSMEEVFDNKIVVQLHKDPTLSIFLCFLAWFGPCGEIAIKWQ
jgi:hypothetical protein